ncbi:putative membrane protein [Ananas comosus]|uniref:Putative membrane protein n=1 Tax=Ananas comosus TaxID=4615 RepID=A0A199VIW3_ANACO|nr:putative membrane protein [Ananas comosus]
MGSRFPSHQLSNGLYVSGRPETPKEKPPTMSSAAMPYTGGDIKRSGELGKMFDLHAEKSRKSGPLGSAPSRTASFGAANSNSGSLSKQKTNSGPLNKHGDSSKRSSGPQSAAAPPVLPTTGLITSGPILSGSLNSSGAPRKVSGSLDSTNSVKLHSTTLAHNQAVTKLIQDDTYSFKRSFPKPILWSVILLFVMGLIAGGFILGAVHNALLLIVVVVLFGAVSALFIWNSCSGRKAPIRFINRYPDAELRTAKDGQYVKVSGVVTCGNFPLESSYQRVPRCVYTSTSLYEYRGWNSKPSNPKHSRFTWGLRAMERHVVDFYISDFQSGLRALVKTGCGAKVTPYVDESIVVDINPENKDKSPEFMRWLRERNLSSDGRLMRLREGYIKEGSTVSVMGVVRRNENVLMIVPPPEPLSTGCQWAECILPASLEGIILRSEDTSTIDVVPV